MKGFDIKSTIDSIINNLPWKEFFTGLFIPINILQVFMHLKKPLLGVISSLGWCLLIIIIDLVKEKRWSFFSLITGIMIFLNAAPSFLPIHVDYHIYVQVGDNLLFGGLFLFSIFVGEPFILKFVSDEALENIPDKVKRTPYFIQAWKGVSATWGITYVLSCVVIVYLNHINSPHVKFVDFLLTWPVVLILLIFSVLYPRFYWTSNRDKIHQHPSNKELTEDK